MQKKMNSSNTTYTTRKIRSNVSPADKRVPNNQDLEHVSEKV